MKFRSSRSRWCKTCEQRHAVLNVSQSYHLLVLDVVLLRHSEATYSAVHHHISSHLKMAPHRHGGAGKGCHMPSRLNVNQAAPVDDDDDHDDDDDDDDARLNVNQAAPVDDDDNDDDNDDDDDDDIET